MKALWSGRFKKGMHPLLKEFSYSLLVDSRLLFAEIKVNEAYAKMLAKIRVLSAKEMRRILKALARISKSWKYGDACRHFKEVEDVHTFIQQELERIAGPAAKKIHTGRSRNDLVVTSTQVYLKEELLRIEGQVKGVQKSLVGLAKKAGHLKVPGLTHLRKAQPVLLAHHLLAYVEMLEDDFLRLQDARKRMKALPLGSAALAGSSLPLDRKFLARQLGFETVSANSMASTSDRAFAAEILSALAILWMHLSRLSEDFILWNSEFLNYIELSDEFATGSSLMPQKKNPDLFELIRGRAGVIFGHLQSVLVVQKGLPLAYNRDLQEDKPGLFDALTKTGLALRLLTEACQGVSLNPKAAAESLEDDAIYATDLLEYLVRKKIPFSEAHETVGKAVGYSREEQRPLRALSLEEWKKFSRAFDRDLYDLFDPSVSVSAKKTLGSTNPAFVKREIAKWERVLK